MHGHTCPAARMASSFSATSILLRGLAVIDIELSDPRTKKFGESFSSFLDSPF